MARILITGSSDGLGLLAAKALVKKGHSVVIHARNETRGQSALDLITGAESLIIGDLSNTEETKQLAHKVNLSGKFDAIIHNAGVYNASSKEIFTVNTLAPYLLTCLIEKPKRLIYLSSGMHMQGLFRADDLKGGFNNITYSDSKLHVLMLCKAVAWKWPQVYANALNPGWVPTKMGGQAAPDDLEEGYETQVWLAESEQKEAMVSGQYFYHKKQVPYNNEADDVLLQNKLLDLCREITGISFPGHD